ncbi:hypothetical protein AB0K12_24370 [Nonomuraea sp. NPDC049419]|uniref:hypothetical protein n=1 Tax=Nonomuraea sp. NPDC049419 TaxID=3155772 RepID=UPI003422A910
MVAIGFALLGVGLVVAVMLALADPVLLSRINGEHAEGGSGRFINADLNMDNVDNVDSNADVVRLPARSGGDRRETRAA